MTLKSRIYSVKDFEQEVDISYGRTYHTSGKSRIGVVPAGYADGLSRGLSNQLSMITKEGPAPVRGRICMDMCMIDLTALPGVKTGDEVEIFGASQPLDALAARIGTVPNELMCAVSRRVPRIYRG